MKKFITLKSVIVLFCILTLILVSAYFINFRSGRISDDPAHWGQFGDYFGMIVNLAGTVAVFILSYLVFNGQNERDKWEKNILELNETPVLIFSAENNVYNKCINVGKGSAHKVIIGKIPFSGKETVIKAYSIPANGYLQITWANDPNELYAYYESIHGRKYLVKCSNDINTYLINGVDKIEIDTQKKIVDWLISAAIRHPGISLRMIGN